MLKVINIEWDTDNDHNLQNALPKEIDIPESINTMDDISDYISDMPYLFVKSSVALNLS